MRLLTPPPRMVGCEEGPACDEELAKDDEKEEVMEDAELMSDDVETDDVEVGETVTEARFFDGFA